MNLLIDIGNSRIKWATLIRGQLHPAGDAERPEHENAVAACAAQWWGNLTQPKQIIVSNVTGPTFAAALEEWTTQQWQLQPRFVVAEANAFGITNGYAVPERLGPDRWASLIAAHRRCNGAACIVDAGTAVTIDVLAADGAHQGGLIIPGLDMMRNALLEGTRDIRPATVAPARGNITLLARDTRDGVDGGTLYTLVAVIDRVVADIGSELGGNLTCYLSGGGAGDLLPLLAGDYHHVPELVLEGLAVIAEKT